MHLLLPSQLLQPGHWSEQGAEYGNLRPNDIRCELWLSLLDVIQWWDQHSFQTDTVSKSSSSMPPNERRLCGLLHVCFLAWDSGQNVHSDTDRLCQWLSRTRDCESNHWQDLQRGTTFSSTVLRENADLFAKLCVRWIRSFWQDSCLEDRICLEGRYIQAFQTMHQFVSRYFCRHPVTSTDLLLSSLTEYCPRLREAEDCKITKRQRQSVAHRYTPQGRGHV